MSEILQRLLRERILILDGAMGTMIQDYGLDEDGYRGDAFRDHGRDVKGCNDLLSLTQPAIVEEIHTCYLEAGADIIETNSFTATSVSLRDYGLESHAVDINRAAAEIATRAAQRMTALTPDRPRFVAGSIGPTNRTASISPDVSDPASRSITFDQLERSYYEEVRGLMAGGVDLLLPEKQGMTSIPEFLREFPDLKIIAISGAGREFLALAKKLGAQRAYTKPLELDELMQGVKELLGD